MTEYLARISARKPFLIIAIWAVIGLVAGGFAVDAEIAPWPPPLTDFLDRATTTEFKLSSSAGSERADRLLEDRLRGPKPVTELIIFQSDSVTVDDPSFLPKVQEVATDILALGTDIVALPPDFDPATPPPISEDRSTTFFAVIMTGSFEDAVDNVPELLNVVEEANEKDGFRVLLVGDASTAHDNNELSENDLRRGERVGLPIALIILIVLFGTIAAALMPVGLSIAAIMVALGITALVGQVFDLTIFVTLMIIMIGLAVGIDYSLVIISRYRDELARGLDTKPAIERAGATAGRTVPVQRHHSRDRPLWHPDCSLLLLSVPGYWGNSGRTSRVGGHAHPSARQPCDHGPENQPTCPYPSSASLESRPPSPPGRASGSL